MTATANNTAPAQKISIHTSAQGTTGRFAAGQLQRGFHPTPPRGGRHTRHRPPLARGQDFNPRTRAGCDCTVARSDIRGTHFNPRTLVGCDRCGSLSTALAVYFNPRTCVGGDLFSQPPPVLQRHFNPHTHTGCDDRVMSSASSAVEFQSSHPRGVRLGIGADVAVAGRISIHAPARGAAAFGRAAADGGVISPPLQVAAPTEAGGAWGPSFRFGGSHIRPPHGARAGRAPPCTPARARRIGSPPITWILHFNPAPRARWAAAPSPPAHSGRTSCRSGIWRRRSSRPSWR